MVKLSQALKTSIRQRVVEFKKKSVELIAEDARRQWAQASGQRIVPEVKVGENRAVIGVPLSSDDPNGDKLRAIDRQTQASARVLKNLRSSAYIKGLLKEIKD